MNSLMSRRGLLASSTPLLVLPDFLAPPASAAQSAPTRLLVERRTIEVDGHAASVFGIRQPDGTPGIVLDPGQSFSAPVANRCGEATIIHWHGQTPPPPFLQDGVAETGGAIIQSGTVQGYDFPARRAPIGCTRITVDNPGRWLFHCHNLFHMSTGMMTELAYDGIA